MIGISWSYKTKQKPIIYIRYNNMQRRVSVPCSSIKAVGHISTTSSRSSILSSWMESKSTAKVKVISNNVGDHLPIVRQLSYIAIKNDNEVRHKKHKQSPHHRRARAVLMGAILEYKPMNRDVLPSYYRYTM